MCPVKVNMVTPHPTQGHYALPAARKPPTCFQIMVSGGGTETWGSLMHMVDISLSWLGICAHPTVCKIWGKDLNNKESRLFCVPLLRAGQGTGAFAGPSGCWAQLLALALPLVAQSGVALCGMHILPAVGSQDAVAPCLTTLVPDCSHFLALRLVHRCMGQPQGHKHPWGLRPCGQNLHNLLQSSGSVSCPRRGR